MSREKNINFQAVYFLKNPIINSKSLAGILLGLFLFSFSACCTPPCPPPPPPPEPEEIRRVPLTAALIERLEQLERLNKDKDKDKDKPILGRFQLFLLGHLTLEHRNTTSTLKLDDRGIGSLTNVHSLERIIINDQTPGIIIGNPLRRVVGPPERRVPGIETTCFVDFDELVNPANSFLRFSNRGDNDGFFYLAYEAGEVQIKGKKYEVNYAGDTPYLLIQLSQKDLYEFSKKTLKGRLMR